MSGRSWPTPCPGCYSCMHWNLMMEIPNELEGLEGPDEMPEAEATKPKGKRKPAAPPKPPPTAEELAATAAHLQAICEQVSERDAARQRSYLEGIANRMSLDRVGTVAHTAQVYWDSDGWTRCCKCHQYTERKAPEELRRCMGHPTGHHARSHAAHQSARAEAAALMREEGERRRAIRLAGREAGRKAARLTGEARKAEAS